MSSVGCTLVGVHTGHGDCRKMLSLRLLIVVSCVSQGIYIRIVMSDIINRHVFGVPPFFECRYCAHAQKKCLKTTLCSNGDTLSYSVTFEETKAFCTG